MCAQVQAAGIAHNQLQSQSDVEAESLQSALQQLQQEQHSSREQLVTLLNKAAAACQAACPDGLQQVELEGEPANL